MVGIQLGLQYTPVSGDPILPAFFLAKEYLTLIHGIALFEEFYDISRKINSNLVFTDLSGREITDPVKQKAVGRRLLYNNLLNNSGSIWKALDGFSILMLGPVLRELVLGGKIGDYKTLGPFARAANLFTAGSVELQKNLVDFMNDWRLKDGFTFPTGYGARSLNEPFFIAVMNLQSQIEAEEKKEKVLAEPRQ